VKPLALLLGLSLSFSQIASAGVIVSSSRPLRMSYSEPLPPKEYYVNLGAQDGLKIGDHLQVRRAVGMSDMFSENAVHLVQAPLADLQVVAMGETGCIARQDTTRTPTSLPSFQFMGPMIGDEVVAVVAPVAKTELPLAPPIP
jgi:hypothetical protein